MENNEQENQLLENNQVAQDYNQDENDEMEDILPPSSRVKKILKWNKDKMVFEMEP